MFQTTNQLYWLKASLGFSYLPRVAAGSGLPGYRCGWVGWSTKGKWPDVLWPPYVGYQWELPAKSGCHGFWEDFLSCILHMFEMCGHTWIYIYICIYMYIYVYIVGSCIHLTPSWWTFCDPVIWQCYLWITWNGEFENKDQTKTQWMCSCRALRIVCRSQPVWNLRPLRSLWVVLHCHSLAGNSSALLGG